jgi:ribonucleoside-diphosphate reductase alpha chain
MGRRTLGIGVINFAYWLAKNGKRYSDGSANNLTHQTFEAIQYYLMKASNELAKEQGACPWFNETTYAKGILPIDTYKKDLDAIVSEPLHLDWEGLRESIKTHGLRNSTLSALMPSETSSQISNATNGIEPPRATSASKRRKTACCVRWYRITKRWEQLRAAVGNAKQRRLPAAGGYHAEVYRPVDLCQYQL